MAQFNITAQNAQHRLLDLSPCHKPWMLVHLVPSSQKINQRPFSKTRSWGWESCLQKINMTSHMKLPLPTRNFPKSRCLETCGFLDSDRLMDRWETPVPSQIIFLTSLWSNIFDFWIWNPSEIDCRQCIDRWSRLSAQLFFCELAWTFQVNRHHATLPAVPWRAISMRGIFEFKFRVVRSLSSLDFSDLFVVWEYIDLDYPARLTSTVSGAKLWNLRIPRREVQI